MNTAVDVQFAIETAELPSEAQLQGWVDTALAAYPQHFSLCIRIVYSSESQSLNSDYRGQDKPTNVLSFSFEMPECVSADAEILGDLVICAPGVAVEAEQQGKELFDHWAHMVIHGTLHLLGFDHIEEQEALEMEQLARDLLAKLQITDPYLSE